MQNLPLTAVLPASPVPQPVSTDSNATQASEPFSNVLSRQRANAQHLNTSTPNTEAKDSNKAGSSSASDASSTSANEHSTGLQTPAAVSTLPGELLAALLPLPPATDRVDSSEKTDMLTPSQGAVTALPGEMLAALLPASTTAGNTAANEKDRMRERAPNEAGTPPADMLATLISAPAALQERNADLRPHPLAAGVSGLPVQSANIPVQSANIQDTPSLSRAQANGVPADRLAAAAQGNTFQAALESMDKNRAIAAQLAANSTEFSAPAKQPDAAANLVYLAQNGTAPAAAISNGAAQAAVNTPLAHAAWGEEFGQKITWLATQNNQSAELHLNPPQLGPLNVVLSVSGDQATALFTSPHAAVREAVEQALPRLREMLADSGIMLGNTMVSDQSPKEQQAWLADQQQNRNGNLSGKTGGAAATEDIPSGGAALPARRHQGMVDTFA